MIGNLRQKAKLFRYSRTGSDKNPKKPEVREERLLDQRMNTSNADVLQRNRPSSLKSSAHHQPTDLRTSSSCNSSPTTPLRRKKGGGTGLADSLNSSGWQSQDSVTDGPCEEHNISKSTDEMDLSESLSEVKCASRFDLSVGLIIKGGREEVFCDSAFYGHHLARLCCTHLFAFDPFGELSTSSCSFNF